MDYHEFGMKNRSINHFSKNRCKGYTFRNIGIRSGTIFEKFLQRTGLFLIVDGKSSTKV